LWDTAAAEEEEEEEEEEAARAPVSWAMDGRKMNLRGVKVSGSDVVAVKAEEERSTKSTWRNLRETATQPLRQKGETKGAALSKEEETS
jgi:hypothetical protein